METTLPSAIVGVSVIGARYHLGVTSTRALASALVGSTHSALPGRLHPLRHEDVGVPWPVLGIEAVAGKRKVLAVR